MIDLLQDIFCILAVPTILLGIAVAREYGLARC
jgi:hypothetical protein